MNDAFELRSLEQIEEMEIVLIEYFCAGLKKFPMLYFMPVDYFLKNGKVIFEYNATPDNKIKWPVIEKFEFNNDGLIEKSSVYYGKEDLIRNF